MKRTRAKVGDIVSVPVDDGRIVIGHYLSDDPENGPIVQFYSCPLTWVPSNGVGNCTPLFLPIIVGIVHACRIGRWRIVDHEEVKEFKQPTFISTSSYAGHPGTWWLHDAGKDVELGMEVPHSLRDKETRVVWSAELLEERIRTGTNPFSYEAIVREVRKTGGG